MNANANQDGADPHATFPVHSATGVATVRTNACVVIMVPAIPSTVSVSAVEAGWESIAIRLVHRIITVKNAERNVVAETAVVVTIFPASATARLASLDRCATIYAPKENTAMNANRNADAKTVDPAVRPPGNASALLDGRVRFVLIDVPTVTTAPTVL